MEVKTILKTRKQWGFVDQQHEDTMYWPEFDLTSLDSQELWM